LRGSVSRDFRCQTVNEAACFCITSRRSCSHNGSAVVGFQQTCRIAHASMCQSTIKKFLS
jgi:hypothetical protein